MRIPKFKKLWKTLTSEQKSELAARSMVKLTHLRVIASTEHVGKHTGMIIAISLVEMGLSDRPRTATLSALFPQHRAAARAVRRYEVAA